MSAEIEALKSRLEKIDNQRHAALQEANRLTVLLNEYRDQSARRASPFDGSVLVALRECEAYFDSRADADCDQDGFTPNEEMKLLKEVREAIAKARSTGGFDLRNLAPSIPQIDASMREDKDA